METTMSKKRRRQLLSAGRYALFLIIMYILQGLVFSHFKLFGFVPMLFPTAVIAVAIFGDQVTGAAFGLFAGILCDVALNEPAALFTATYTVMGLLVGAMAESVVTRSILSYCVLSVLALALTAFFQMFSLLFFAGENVYALVYTAIMQTAVSLVFLIPIYPAARYLVRKGQAQ